MKRIAFAAAVAAFCLSAFAQTFPTRPVKIVVPLPPGPLDGTMRLVSPAMAEDLGQPVLVENRPGAAGVIGLEAVARAAPDGYTILGAAGGNFIVAPVVVENHPTNPLRDFSPVTVLYDAPAALVVKRSLPVNTLAEFLDYAKKNPGKLSYGSSGTGGAAHIEGENFKRITGTNLLHVPYKGYGPMVQAILGEEIDALVSVSLSFVQPLANAGKLKILGIHNRRAADLPNLPYLEDVLPGFFSAPVFVGFLAPAATPRPIVMRLNAAAVKAIRNPEVRGKFESQGYTLLGNSPEEMGAMMKQAYERTAQMVKGVRTAGVKLE